MNSRRQKLRANAIEEISERRRTLNELHVDITEEVTKTDELIKSRKMLG